MKKETWTISYKKAGKNYNEKIEAENIWIAIGLIKIREGNIELTGGFIAPEDIK